MSSRPHILNTLFLNPLNLGSFLRVKELKTKFHTHTKTVRNHTFMYFNIQICFWTGDRTIKDSEVNGSKHFLNLLCLKFLCKCDFDLYLLAPANMPEYRKVNYQWRIMIIMFPDLNVYNFYLYKNLNHHIYINNNVLWNFTNINLK